jgi:hypothetical protein
LHSAEQSKIAEKETSESREHATIDNGEAHESFVSHADTSVSDISSQLTTESPSNGRVFKFIIAIIEWSVYFVALVFYESFFKFILEIWVPYIYMHNFHGSILFANRRVIFVLFLHFRFYKLTLIELIIYHFFC